MWLKRSWVLAAGRCSIGVPCQLAPLAWAKPGAGLSREIRSHLQPRWKEEQSIVSSWTTENALCLPDLFILCGGEGALALEGAACFELLPGE